MNIKYTLKISILKVIKKMTGRIMFDKIRAYRYHRYMPNLQNPKTFNERVMYSKLYNTPEIAVKLADKYEVRDYVSSKDPDLLADLYYVGEDPAEIPLDKLPNQFVVKTTHGAGDVFIVKDKSKVDIQKLQRSIKHALKVRLGEISNEWWYLRMKPRFIVEEFLDNGDNEAPADYKFFCFHGKCTFLQIDFGRFTDHTRSFFDRDWNLLDVEQSYGKVPNAEKPDNLEALIETAEMDLIYC